jgi:hypothetical protein
MIAHNIDMAGSFGRWYRQCSPSKNMNRGGVASFLIPAGYWAVGCSIDRPWAAFSCWCGVKKAVGRFGSAVLAAVLEVRMRQNPSATVSGTAAFVLLRRIFRKRRKSSFLLEQSVFSTAIKAQNLRIARERQNALSES